MVTTTLLLLNRSMYLTILGDTSPKTESADLMPLYLEAELTLGGGRSVAWLSIGFC